VGSQSPEGSIFLPTKLTTFYGKLQGAYQSVIATVLDPGNTKDVVEGDVVMFQRISFAFLKKFGLLGRSNRFS